jgi:hypothetical protein
MGKYEPLTEFLQKQPGGEVRMSFAQIERVVGFKLPPVAQRHRAWWSNSPTNNVMTRAWLDAGFRSEQVDMAARKLVFRKGAASSASDAAPRTTENGPKRINIGEHPLFERIRGTAHVSEGVDLTEPADPDWGELAYGSDTDKAQA